jgi:hypothetical protein
MRKEEHNGWELTINDSDMVANYWFRTGKRSKLRCIEVRIEFDQECFQERYKILVDFLNLEKKINIVYGYKNFFGRIKSVDVCEEGLI